LLQRLGRADAVKEFVRKGSDKALIELLISGGPDGEDFRIERELHAADSKSVFRINGEAPGMTSVGEHCHTLSACTATVQPAAQEAANYRLSAGARLMLPATTWGGDW
jgi:hypothetical protein